MSIVMHLTGTTDSGDNFVSDGFTYTVNVIEPALDRTKVRQNGPR